MKLKILTSICAFFIAVMPALAMSEESISLKMTGRLDLIAGIRKQSSIFNYVYDAFEPPVPNGLKMNNLIFANDVMIKFEGQAINGANKVGLFLGVHANSSEAATNQEQSIADKTMVYFQNENIGRFEFGDYPSATAIIEAEHFELSVGGYGIEGYWSRFVNGATAVDATLPFSSATPAFAMLPDAFGLRYLISPNLPSNYSGKHYSDATKVNFLTQPREDTIFGISYIEDLDSSGTLAGIANNNSGAIDEERRGFRPTFRNIISIGIRHEQLLNEKLKGILTIVTEFGRAKLADSDKNFWTYEIDGDFPTADEPLPGCGRIHGIRAYEVGVILKDHNKAISGTYGNWGKTGTYKHNVGFKQGARYWTITTQYQNDCAKYSLGYMNSRRAGGLEAIYAYIAANNHFVNGGITPWPSPGSDTQYNKMNVLSLSTELKSTHQFIPFAEVNLFRLRAPDVNEKNRGIIAIIGGRIKF